VRKASAQPVFPLRGERAVEDGECGGYPESGTTTRYTAYWYEHSQAPCFHAKWWPKGLGDSWAGKTSDFWTRMAATDLPEFRVYAVGEDYASPGPPENGTLAGMVHGKTSDLRTRVGAVNQTIHPHPALSHLMGEGGAQRRVKAGAWGEPNVSSLAFRPPAYRSQSSGWVCDHSRAPLAAASPRGGGLNGRRAGRGCPSGYSGG
jgi:hypothetical protein